MKEKKPGGTRPEMGTPEYEEWRKGIETPQKAPAEGTQKASGHHNSGNDRRSRGISRSRCAEGQK